MNNHNTVVSKDNHDNAEFINIKEKEGKVKLNLE